MCVDLLLQYVAVLLLLINLFCSLLLVRSCLGGFVAMILVISFTNLVLSVSGRVRSAAVARSVLRGYTRAIARSCRLSHKCSKYFASFSVFSVTDCMHHKPISGTHFISSEIFAFVLNYYVYNMVTTF